MNIAIDCPKCTKQMQVIVKTDKQGLTAEIKTLCCVLTRSESLQVFGNAFMAFKNGTDADLSHQPFKTITIPKPEEKQ